MAVSYKDYYKILGVPKTADAKAIKQAYRKLARKYHPDQNPGNNAAAERFKEINEANEVLSDPEKRQRYDTLGPDWARYAEAGAGGFGGRPGGPGPGGYRVHVDPSGGDLGDFSDFFRTIFGDLGARRAPVRGRRVRGGRSVPRRPRARSGAATSRPRSRSPWRRPTRAPAGRSSSSSSALRGRAAAPGARARGPARRAAAPAGCRAATGSR